MDYERKLDHETFGKAVEQIYLEWLEENVKPVEDNLAIQFAEWIPGSGFTQIAKRLGGYWFKSDSAKHYSTKEVFESFLSSLPPVPVKDVPVQSEVEDIDTIADNLIKKHIFYTSDLFREGLMDLVKGALQWQAQQVKPNKEQDV